MSQASATQSGPTSPLQPLQPPSGHVFRVERKRGPVWYAKYRLPDGRQVQQKIGPAWSQRGRPPAGYVTKRDAEEWLRHQLDEVRRGTLRGVPPIIMTLMVYPLLAVGWRTLLSVDAFRHDRPSIEQDPCIRAVADESDIPGYCSAAPVLAECSH